MFVFKPWTGEYLTKLDTTHAGACAGHDMGDHSALDRQRR
jgi:hypothetical protein